MNGFEPNTKIQIIEEDSQTEATTESGKVFDSKVENFQREAPVIQEKEAETIVQQLSVDAIKK